MMAKPKLHAPTPKVSQQTAAQSARVRFVTAASLFDGHDAAINIMRRILQGSGVEVIHLGHNRSVAEIVSAAVQEDANAIAISSYQGGHVEYFKYAVELLRENHCEHIKVFGGGGGTITAEEASELQRHGVKRIYSPEDGRKLGLQGIIDDMVESARRPLLSHTDWLNLESGLDQDRLLAQALTCLEVGDEVFGEKKLPHREQWEALKARCQNPKKKSFVIGITGTGGAGKSSLTDELVLRFLQRKPKGRVAVLAVDPTRKKTGGALLGDRLRMNSLKDPRCFMRSFATRKSDTTLSDCTAEAIGLLQSVGFEWIFVETSGIGQADSQISELVDTTIYVMTSDYGAATQLEKINMLDFADLVVLNKFDKPRSLDALEEVRRQFRRNHLAFEKVPKEKYPVFGTIASRFEDSGVNAAFEHLLSLEKKSGERLCAVQTPIKDFQEDRFVIVPKERAQYLSEISKAVHDYKAKVDKESQKISTLEAVTKTLELGGHSEPVRKELAEQLRKLEKDLDPEWKGQFDRYQEILKNYQQQSYSYEVRGTKTTVELASQSLSGLSIPKIAIPKFQSLAEQFRFMGLENLPGYFPYTAGVFGFKRTEEEPKRMFAGEGTPSRTNRRFHFLCEGEKAQRLSTAFDSVTLYGEDPDERPDIFGKVGESGVSVCTLDDAKKLYAGFDLCDPSVSVSMTINGPAPMLLAFYFNTALDQQVERFTENHKKPPNKEELEKIKRDTFSKIRGTVQADILKEDQAQNTCIFSTSFALKMMGDIQEFFVKNKVQNYYSVSISGYHIAEAGANPISQLAFTLANGFTYVEYYLARGMKIDSFAPNLSFFFSNGLDPEYSVIGRVARRIWAVAMRDLYGGNDRSQKLKYHIQTSGRSLHAQEMSFNDIRTTLQALLAHYDFCNSLHTNAYDEALTTPTEESVRRAMAIQLILTREFGVMKNYNPLQGSFLMETLTDLVEEAVLAEFERLSLRGGVLGAMEAQYQRNKIQEESLKYERMKHSGELPIIGVNAYVNPHSDPMSAPPKGLTRASYDEKNQQIAHLRAFQKTHAKEAPAALEMLKKTARSGGNLFEALLEASRVCSLGQMTHALYETGGEYRRSA